MRCSILNLIPLFIGNISKEGFCRTIFFYGFPELISRMFYLNCVRCDNFHGRSLLSEQKSSKTQFLYILFCGDNTA